MDRKKQFNKVYRLAFGYMIMGLIAGVYYREITKILNFTGSTQLAGAHTHILALGMLVMLIVLLFMKVFNIGDDPKFGRFLSTYQVGLDLTLMMMLVRGTLEVMGTELSPMWNGAISGFSGIGHIIITVGFVFFFGVLKRSMAKEII